MASDVKALISRLRDYQNGALDPETRLEIADALEAAQQAPAVDREALVRAIRVPTKWHSEGERWEPEEWILDEEDASEVADHIFHSGVLQDAAEVEARGLEKAADIAEHPTWHPLGRLNDAEHTASVRIAHAVRSYAQQVREGNA